MGGFALSSRSSLGVLWDSFGAICYPTGSNLGLLWGPLLPPVKFLPERNLTGGTLRGAWVALWGPRGALWGSLGPLGGLLGPSGTPREAIWGFFWGPCFPRLCSCLRQSIHRQAQLMNLFADSSPGSPTVRPPGGPSDRPPDRPTDRPTDRLRFPLRDFI